MTYLFISIAVMVTTVLGYKKFSAKPSDGVKDPLASKKQATKGPTGKNGGKSHTEEERYIEDSKATLASKKQATKVPMSEDGGKSPSKASKDPLDPKKGMSKVPTGKNGGKGHSKYGTKDTIDPKKQATKKPHGKKDGEKSSSKDLKDTVDTKKKFTKSSKGKDGGKGHSKYDLKDTVDTKKKNTKKLVDKKDGGKSHSHKMPKKGQKNSVSFSEEEDVIDFYIERPVIKSSAWGSLDLFITWQGTRKALEQKYGTKMALSIEKLKPQKHPYRYLLHKGANVYDMHSDELIFGKKSKQWNWKDHGISHGGGYNEVFIKYLYDEVVKDEGSCTHLVLSSGWIDVLTFDTRSRKSIDLSYIATKIKAWVPSLKSRTIKVCTDMKQLKSGDFKTSPNQLVIFLLSTGDAARVYNKLVQDPKNKVGAAFHQTC